MLRKFFILGIVCLLFLGVNVLFFFGWDGSENGPFWQKLSPASYIIFLLFFYQFGKMINNRALLVKNRKEEYLALIGLVLLLLFLQFNKQGGVFTLLGNTFFIPVLVSFLLPKQYPTVNLKAQQTIYLIRKLIIVFFVANCGIAIIERILTINFFPFTSGGNVSFNYVDYFRSTALQNHPLNNALITSIIMSFILVSEMKESKKMMLWFFGFVAILCFNTRSSIFGWCAFMGIYIFYQLFYNRKLKVKAKSSLLALVSILIVVGFFLVSYYGLGDRLIEMGLYDENSAGVRLQVFKIFDSYSLGDFLWGLSEQKTTLIASRVDVEIIENFWLIFLFRFGLVFTCILVYLFYRLLKARFVGYNRFSVFFVLLVFLGIASTNNSLATTTVALTLLILCAIAFHPKLISVKKGNHIGRIMNPKGNLGFAK
ncbi:MAG: hypothetical protein E6Q95_05010 [Chitinophagaceae bacterium]|nr:MAG: hypothetical protein E6Q95_05010 [Chitinophagaceae bacterium]